MFIKIFSDDTNSKVSSLSNRITANTNNINSLTTKANSNSSTISNLSNRVTTLESSGSHYWEYVGYLSTRQSVTLTKNYLFIVQISINSGSSSDGRITIVDSYGLTKGYIYKITSSLDTCDMLGYV